MCEDTWISYLHSFQQFQGNVLSSSRSEQQVLTACPRSTSPRCPVSCRWFCCCPQCSARWPTGWPACGAHPSSSAPGPSFSSTSWTVRWLEKWKCDGLYLYSAFSCKTCSNYTGYLYLYSAFSCNTCSSNTDDLYLYSAFSRKFVFI